MTPTKTVWERLRERMEQLNAARSQGPDAAAIARKLLERAKVFQRRAGKVETTQPRLSIVAFRKAKERYGIPVSEVLEVQALQYFSPVPGTPGFIRGAVPWRGAIISLLDLGRLLGVPDPGLTDLRACLIVEASGKRIAVAAGEVETVMAIPSDQIKALPSALPSAQPEWALGVHDENRLILSMAEILKSPVLTDWKNRKT